MCDDKGETEPETQCCDRCDTLWPGPGTLFGCKAPSQ